ncbi:MAG: 4Fe-4S dicluster domain-containing protein [Thermoproteota archaeon]
MAEKGFLFVDPEKCVGCHICELVCSWEKEGTYNPLKSRIRVIHIPPFLNLAITCRLCEDTPCISACPRDALSKSPKTGAILVDDDRCDGCGWCIDACPYGAIKDDVDTNTVLVCDLCGGEPKCKDLCPEEAIDYMSEESDIQKAWIAASRKCIESAEDLISSIKGEGTADFFKDADEIMNRVEEKYKELFAKKEQTET